MPLSGGMAITLAKHGHVGVNLRIKELVFTPAQWNILDL